jgi:hypothetical protein
MLSTTIPIPSAVSNSITSAVAETASSATATVSVIINQVFALGLPCSGESKSGLSTGAEAGIGVGAGVGGLLLIGLIVFTMVLVGKKRLKQRQQAPPMANTSYYPPQDNKHMSATTGAMSPYTSMGSPALGQMSPQFQPQMPSYSFPPSSAFGSEHPHGRWGPQPQSLPPQYRGPPAEMQAPITHEIGDGQRVVQPSSPDVISSTGSNTAASVSAYTAQQGRTE